MQSACLLDIRLAKIGRFNGTAIWRIMAVWWIPCAGRGLQPRPERFDHNPRKAEADRRSAA